MYCKNCKVRLKSYLKECPLCNTPINNEAFNTSIINNTNIKYNHQ